LRTVCITLGTGKVVPLHSMMAYWRIRGIAPRILNLCARRVVNHTHGRFASGNNPCTLCVWG